MAQQDQNTRGVSQQAYAAGYGGTLPGAAPEDQFIELEDFAGINTRSPRMSIMDNEFSWLENMFPIGRGNMRVVYGIGDSIYTAAAGKTIVSIFFYNIESAPYCAVFLDDGTAYQVPTGGGSPVTISATPGTFYNGNFKPACVQWGNEYLLITNTVSTDCYYVWDGAVLYGAGSLGPLVTVVNGGSGYDTAPTVTISGGSGTGATATATIANGVVTEVNITNAGSGYVIGDRVLFSFSGGTPDAGVMNSIIVINGGSGYTSTPTVSFSGGGGTGATATATVSGGRVTSIAVTNAGSGYTSTPTVNFSGGGGSGAVATPVISTVAAATGSIMPFGISGNAIETYTNRVWVFKENNRTNSAPGSISDFTTTNGGGTAKSSDSFLKVRYVGAKSVNGFLYTYGDSSINAINNVNTGGSPVITTYNNQNSDPQIGTPWRDSLVNYGRLTMFANRLGIYSMLGGSAVKVSDNLDGIFASATFPENGGIEPSSAVADIFGIRVFLMIMEFVDTMSGQTRPMMMAWDGRKFFIVSQEVDFTYIAPQEINSQLTAWGTDGINIYPMFQSPSTTLMKKGRTKFYVGPTFISQKQVRRAYLMSFDNGDPDLSDFNVYAETETSSVLLPKLDGSQSSVLQFINNMGDALNFVNNASAELFFISSGINIQGSDSPSYGNLIGLSFDTTASDYTVVNFSMIYRNQTLLA